MSDRAPPQVLAALREILENQIAANDPPETGATLVQLRRTGIPEETAWQMLSAVLLQEMSLMVSAGRLFDRDGYVAALHHLPELGDR
jgi:hypothetical protein